MADGSSGGIGGILFEAGKAAGSTIKNQAQQTASAIGTQVTGNAKPLFGGQKPSGGQLPKDPLGGLGGNFGKMFESGKGGFGTKPSPLLPPTPQYSQADLDAMAAQNKVIDDQAIAKRQAELEQLKQQHKMLHDEVYYDAIKNAGQNTILQERKEKEEAKQQEEDTKQQKNQQSQLGELSPNMMGKNPQLGTPVAVTQARTQTEANRGTTG